MADMAKEIVETNGFSNGNATMQHVSIVSLALYASDSVPSFCAYSPSLI